MRAATRVYIAYTARTGLHTSRPGKIQLDSSVGPAPNGDSCTLQSRAAVSSETLSSRSDRTDVGIDLDCSRGLQGRNVAILSKRLNCFISMLDNQPCSRIGPKNPPQRSADGAGALSHDCSLARRPCGQQQGSAQRVRTMLYEGERRCSSFMFWHQSCSMPSSFSQSAAYHQPPKSVGGAVGGGVNNGGHRANSLAHHDNSSLSKRIIIIFLRLLCKLAQHNTRRNCRNEEARRPQDGTV